MPIVADPSSSCSDISAFAETEVVALAGDPARSILYIHDDRQQPASWRDALSSAGYVVSATVSPAAGLCAYLDHRFDAVILAFQLPFVSSGLLATVMHLFRRGTPLILLADSGASSAEELAPFDRVFPKNTAPAVVLGGLHGLIERARRAELSPIAQLPGPPAGDSGTEEAREI